MKKIVLGITLGAVMGVAQAQKIRVSDAKIYLRTQEVSEAKKAVDEAALNPDTKNAPAMWAIRTAVYDTILHGPDHKSLRDANTVENFVLAAQGCMKTEQKGADKTYCEYAIINASFDAYNKAFDYMRVSDYANAIKFYNYTLENVKWDKDKQMEKNNLSDKNIHLAIADASYRGKDYATSKKHLQALMDMKYNDAVIYSFMSSIYLEEGDTAKGMSFIEAGRKAFPKSKDLINLELNIYLVQGRSGELLSKINDALANDPENSSLLYIQGNIYDKFAGEARTKWKSAKEESEKLNKKANNEKVPATKVKLQAQAKKQKNVTDSLEKQMRDYIAKAEASYTRTIEISGENPDGHYAMGALLNNFQNQELVDKINQMGYVPDTDPKYLALKKQQDEVINRSIKYLNDAYSAAENLSGATPDAKAFRKENKIIILTALMDLYKTTSGYEAKYIETKKLLEEVQAKE